MASLVIGTRGSRLALAQTHTVAESLRRAHPGLEITTVTIQTQGDATQAANVPLSTFGEKGIFAKELEVALLAGEIDLAVHSMKDMAHTLPDGLALAAVPPREDSRDALLGASLDALPRGARVGTGSVRRRALLLSRRPDLDLREIRGNVDTRLTKLQRGEYDAICLAVAGLSRLGLRSHIREILDPGWFTPDPGQGALCLEIRADDRRVREWTAPLNHTPSRQTVEAERAFLRAIGGSCKTPVGAAAVLDGTASHSLTLTGIIAAPDGTTVLRRTQVGPPGEGERLGREVAEALRMDGAGRFLGTTPE